MAFGENLDKKDITYFYIHQGNIKFKVQEGEQGGVKRVYEVSEGVQGVKYEVIKRQLVGIITDIKIKNGTFGGECQVYLRDGGDQAIFTIPVKSDFFDTFAKKIGSADLSQLIAINTYEFDGEKGKRQVITLMQNNVKLGNYFWDGEKNLHGFPVADENPNWGIYFLQVRDFLKKHVLSLFDIKDKSEVSVKLPELKSMSEAVYKNFAKGVQDGKIEDVKNLLKDFEASARKTKIENLIKLT